LAAHSFVLRDNARIVDVIERRYRETSGLYWEDFEPGDVFEHRPGRTVLDVDNTYFTLLTLKDGRPSPSWAAPESPAQPLPASSHSRKLR
jgi:hypothetical protein